MLDKVFNFGAYANFFALLAQYDLKISSLFGFLVLDELLPCYQVHYIQW